MICKTRTTAATQPQPIAGHEGGHAYTRPSKSQLKREMTALQALGTEIVELPKDALKRLLLPEDLADAVHEARRITDHEGKRRQLQYVGRVMRALPDTDVAALRDALDAYKGVNKAETARLHWVERTREQLLENDDALTEFLRVHPGAHVQQGRTLIRNARREVAQGKPPRHFRELFQWIKEAAGDPGSATQRDEAPSFTDDEQDHGDTADRASTNLYEDQGIPALRAWLADVLTSPWRAQTRLIADDATTISRTLIELVDDASCNLVLTTGGTGPTRRDVTPEATIAVGTKTMPGFGEQMRQISLHFVPTAILSRQVAVVRETADHAALIVNLPGQPKSIRETLEGLRDTQGNVIVNGIFAAIPYCIDLIGGPYIETDAARVNAFRPKSAIRQKPPATH
ncbi:hypothetical protein DFQ28_006196 [Apophysomyces sp. BC1034]|nr:hypothetical protein DFQ30_002360 [Apophysomyces sp. BC1015]KAG0193187.1 hypothetical protein DFQ28_006196 [Apophysomyces sp. BC1034]